ncbi:Rgp1-domain-containing protein [Lactarius sanguifluus]|nr:Rgp1-domain-containing protein [Lactarius sanguifluus]
MSEVRDFDTALRVVVTPSQSSYFAGEPLSVTITITNVRSPQAQVAPPRSTHKRSAHSVSSARLARPPTSPGLPKSPLTAPLRHVPVKVSAPTRKGLIGTAPPRNGCPDVSCSERRVPARSLSVDIPFHELFNSFPDDTKKTSLLRATNLAGEHPLQSPYLFSLHTAGQSSSHTSSPLARTSTTPVPPNHPHARKLSVSDVSAPIPQSASSSSFALSLDPIAETMSPIPPTPTFPSPAPTPSTFTSPHAAGTSKSASPAYPPRPDTQHPTQSFLGNGRPSSFKSLPRDNTELVLYAYVHLTGSFFLLPSSSLARPSALAALQRHKRGPRGGGSMDIGVASPPPRGHERRSASIAGSLWGLISSPASAVLSPGHRARAPSHGGTPHTPPIRSFAGAGAKVANPHGTEGIGLGIGGVGLGMGAIQEDDDDWDPDQPMSVFEVPPAMLAVDLSLGPGEERSYVYTVTLPPNLPPTYRGRSLRFSYNLSVGACRATAGSPTSQSRVMKVPIRIYNHVSVSRPPRWYDLLTGLSRKIEEKLRGPSQKYALKARFSVLPLTFSKQSQASSVSASRGSVSDLRTYAVLLLEPNSAALSAFPAVHVTMDDQELTGPDGGLTGCREAVEVLTRVSKKVSYDVNKDGVKVAVLTFVKSAWRLGETVLGVVELNDRGGRARILKASIHRLSAMLEAHESLPSEIAASPDARHASYMRRVHAEHHASFIPQTQRTTFALDIPPDAAPAFRLSLGGGPSEGGLAWKVRLCLLVAISAPGAQVRGMVRDGPRGQWGSTWVPTDSLAPRERPPKVAEPAKVKPAQASSPQVRSWASFLASTFLSVSEGGFHDGDEALTDEEDGEGLAEGEVDIGAGEEGWRELVVETVECEVPVTVWPGNTVFRPEDVVFDV